MFRLSTELPLRTARTHAACASLSFINNVKQQGSVKPPIDTADDNFAGSLSETTGVSASYDMNSREFVGRFVIAASLSGVCIVGARSECQAFVGKFLPTRKPCE
jgi:hypothetical protein